MLYTARMISDSFEEDPDHRGFILVQYKQQTQWARPALPFGSFRVPTKEWIQKYAKDAIDVFVSPVNGDEYLVYTGFTVYADKLPSDALTNYGYRRIFFTENWTEWYDDTDQNNNFVLKHKDGTQITIDRTPAKENITIQDGLSGDKILLDKTGIQINGDYVLLKGFLDLLLQNQAMIGIDSLSGPVQLSPNMITAIQEALAQSNKIISKNV